MENRRANALLRALAGQNAQGAVLVKPSNVRWLSGYMGEGLLVLTEKGMTVVTDFRYVEAAEKQAPGCAVRSIAAGVPHEKIAAEVLHEAGVKTAAFEDDVVTVRSMRALTDASEGIAYEPLKTRPEKLRAVKDADEIAAIEEACGISCKAFERILEKIRPGVTEREIAFALEDEFRALGAEGTAFETIVAAGENGSLPHAIPGSRVIENGMLVTMDFGARVRGYCSDMTRTVATGAVDGEMRRLYDTVRRAQELALEYIDWHKSCFEADRIARDYINQNGYEGAFGHSLGHGVGLYIHENPRLSPACKPQDILENGDVVTCEPGIYLAGKYGVRIEDMVLIHDGGAEAITRSPKELIIL